MSLHFIYKILFFVIINKSIIAWTKYHRMKHILSIKMNNKDKDNQCIISSKNNNILCNEDAKKYLIEDSFLSNKKLITVSPGGFKGFYILGILTYLKETYNLDDYIFSGASAGSWNSLFMCYKGDPLEFVYNLMDYNIKKAKTITELQYFLKYKLLTTCKEDDFDLRKLFIGVTTLKNFKFLTNIFSDFENLDDAINCCMASSFIPLITGGLSNKYHNMFTFDGGFSTYPYLNKEKTVIHISPSMWDDLKHDKNKQNSIKGSIRTIKQFSEFFSVSKNNLLELFDNGYHDAKIHKEYLDELFPPKIEDDMNLDIIEI